MNTRKHRDYSKEHRKKNKNENIIVDDALYIPFKFIIIIYCTYCIVQTALQQICE